MHCHIAWHASQGLALQFVERESEVSGVLGNYTSTLNSTCGSWNAYTLTEVYTQSDSGI
jgi:Multicopper oxidase